MHGDKAQRAELLPNLRAAPLTRVKNRDVGLDIARGFAMILVVFGHALVGALGAGLISDNTERVLTAIYAVHMPLFFMISGYLAPRLINLPTDVFAARFWSRLVWPYLLWSLVLMSVHFLMRAYTNTAMTGFHPLTILWKPPAVMWFLYYLGFAILITRAVKGAPNTVRAALGMAVISAPYILPALPDQTRFIGFFILGTMIPNARISGPFPKSSTTVAVIITALSLLMLWTLPIDNTDAYPASQIWLLPAAFAGPFLLYRASQYVALNMPDAPIMQVLRLIGQNTMPVFVLHILITAGTRIGLLKIGVTDWAVIICAATFLGLIIPLLVGQIANRAGIEKWLGWR